MSLIVFGMNEFSRPLGWDRNGDMVYVRAHNLSTKLHDVNISKDCNLNIHCQENLKFNAAINFNFP
jgi:hypothetical protein